MPPPEHLSTGQAAKLLAVTADTVLKWIKKGKLNATRTAGGHYRVHWSEVQRMLGGGPLAPDASPSEIYCWEFHGDVHGNCASCLVYRAQAKRCFMLSDLPVPSSHAGTHCQTSCLDCAYYLAHFQDRIRVLIVLNDPALRESLASDPHTGALDLRFAGNLYQAAAAAHDFEPSYVIVHPSLATGCQTLKHAIATDPHMEGVRVLCADGSELPERFDLSLLQRTIWRHHRSLFPATLGGAGAQA